MKHSVLFLLLFTSLAGYSQSVMILDSNVSYDSLAAQNILTVFLSPPVANADLITLNVRIGNNYGASDVFSSDYTVGTNVNVTSNKLQVPLSGVSSGNYFVAVTITRSADASTQLMEYRIQ